MVMAFQITLLIIIMISLFETIGERDKSLQEKISVMFLSGLAVFILSVLWF